MSKGQMIDFLIDLSLDHDKLEQFDKDPKAVVTAAGFKDHEAEVLISRDYRRVTLHLKPVKFQDGDDIPNFTINRPAKKKKKAGGTKKTAGKKTNKPKKKK